MCFGSHPLGIPHTSSYSGANQREYGILAAPHLGCCLYSSRTQRDGYLKTTISVAPACRILYMLWPVVALACDGSVTLRETVYLTAGRLQLSGAARHMQQILRIFFTQHFWGSTVSTTRSKLVTLKHKEIYMRKIRSIVVSFPVKSRYKWFKWSKWSKSISGIWFCWAWLCFSSLHESTYAD